MESEALTKITGVSIGYGATSLLDNINLEILPGDFLGLVGPNGAGKSTLLRTMLGVLRPLAGRVINRPGLRFGYVPQRTRIDPIFPLTVIETVRQGGMGRKPEGRGSRLAGSTRREGMEALVRLGVADLADRALRDLSGGQQQRVLIARALVRGPDLLVLDEPTAGMDIPSEKELLDFVTALSRDQRLTVILVAHQLALVAGRASRLALINKDLPLFAAGDADELLTDERLSALYKHPMRVVDAGGIVTVQAGRSEIGR
jgi:ABC-type Mn2+/Zn2+ transport system ATPase subunit